MQIYVNLTQIEDNPFQRRVEYGDIEELAGRIAAARESYPETGGLMQIPRGRLIVAGTGTAVPAEDITLFAKTGTLAGDLQSGLFRVQLAFGHRRYRAFCHLQASGMPGYDRFPVHVDGLSDAQMLDAVWAENYERKDISAVEQAELLKAKLEQVAAIGGSQRDVADAWGLARPTVTNRLSLLKLPPAIQEANRRGDLSERQCLSLAQIADLDDLVGDGKWGKVGGSQWDKPPAPADYIAHVLEKPDTTSEAIREMSKRMVNYAGRPLPDTIAAHDFAPAFLDGGSLPGLQQYTCKGCPFRINKTCLSPDCLAAKERAFGEAVARAAAEELGLPFSDDPAHFAWGRPEREKLEAYYDGGGRQDVVVGWMGAGEYAVRPFNNNASWLHTDDLYKNGGRSGMALGHRTGNLPTAAEEVEDIADKAMVEEWKKRVKKRGTAVRKRAKEALAAELAGVDMRLLAAFVAKEGTELGDDHRELEKMVVDYLWDNGRWHGYLSTDDLPGELEAIGAVLDKAGIGRGVLVAESDKFTDLAERTVMWLDFWYGYREYSWMKNRWEEAKTAITALRGEFEALGLQATGGELLRLGMELDRAARDIEKKMAERG
jgi:ParB/RepB/Spo0J family partition protein